MAIGIGLILLVLGFHIARAAQRKWRKEKFLRESFVPSTHDVQAGICAVEGRAEPLGDMVEAPLSGQECIAYSFDIEKGILRRDGEGTTTEWETEDSGAHCPPFFVTDDAGKVLVAGPNQPPGRIILDLKRRQNRHYSSESGPSGVLFGEVGDEVGKRKTEYILRPGERVVVMGEAKFWVRADRADSEEERFVFNNPALPESGSLITTHPGSAGTPMAMFRVYDRGAKRLRFEKLALVFVGVPVGILFVLGGLIGVAGGIAAALE